MRRRTLAPAAWLARAIAIGAVVVIVGLGLGIPGQRGRYQRAVRDQRNDVTRLAAANNPAPPTGDRTLCARGVTGFASAAAAVYGAGLRDADGVIVPAALAAVSGAALEADRWAEQGGFDGATPGPALPQRVGVDATGATVAPPQANCEGGTAFAQAQISGRGLPAGAAPTPTAASSAKQKPAKQKPRAKQPPVKKPRAKQPPEPPPRTRTR